MEEQREVTQVVETEEQREVTQVVSSMEPVVMGENVENISCMDRIFYEAAFEGNMDAFKEKGSEEIEERMLTPNKNTILHIHLTSDKVSEQFVEGILQMCPALLKKPNVKGETLLHIAARYGHDKIVKKLVQDEKKTMLIRAVDKENNTALHEAVRFRHIEIVHILTMGDPHYSYFGNKDGETPLYMAAERQYGDVVIKILENCESPNQDGPNGRTALHAALLRDNNREIVSKLLSKSQVKKADENGWIPLHLAALNLDSDLTKMLLECERSTAYMRDKRGRTALHLAARCGHDNVMNMIIEHCPDCVELVDENGFNALHYTVHMRNTGCTKVIMENTSLSNLYNEKDYNGNTPLHHLARTPRFDMRDDDEPLLAPSKRVDTMAFNKKNQTAIDVANESLPPTSYSSLYSKKLFLGNKLKDIGVKFGGRMVNKNEIKMIKFETREQGSESSVLETKKKLEANELINKFRENNFIVATLITTVTFAAAFTLPGGVIQEFNEPEKGSPILKRNHAFQAFVITDSISFVLSASAVLLLLCSSTIVEIYWFIVYKRVISFAINTAKMAIISVAQVLTIGAMFFLIIAFVTGTYAVLGTSSKSLAVVTLLIGLSFFASFLLLRCVQRGMDYNEKKRHFHKPDRAIYEGNELFKSESVRSGAYPEP